MSDFLMPSLGPDMESARVIEWLVKPGDSVRRGDVIVVVETEKGAIEIEVFDDGVVESLVAPLEAELVVGAVLARIRKTAEGAATVAAVPSSPPAGPAAVAAAPSRPLAAAAAAAPGMALPPHAGERVRASPAARKHAAALGVDLATLAGHGPGGAVTLADVAAAASAAGATQRRSAGFDAGAMRRAIGHAMSRAKREIPHYYLSQSFSMGPALAWLAAANRERAIEQRLLPAVLLLRAAGLAVTRIAGFSGVYTDDAFHPAPVAHVGWAVALRGGGLIAPAIHDVAALALDPLMTALRDLVRRARAGGLRSSELMDATVTVTSLGDRGAEAVWPVIYPPQVAMLGFGGVVERAWVVDGRVEIQPVITVSLAGDHRVTDGHAGSLLLAEIERLLNRPEEL